MIFSRALLESRESLEDVYAMIEEVSKQIGASIDDIHKSDYRIIGKASVIRRIGKNINFHFVLTKSGQNTAIEFYDECSNIHGPYVDFLMTLIKLLESKTLFLKPYVFDVVYKEKTENGMIIVNRKVNSSFPQINVDDFEYESFDVSPIGKYGNENIRKIRLLTINIGGSHDMLLQKNDKSPYLFRIEYQNIKELKVIKLDKGLFSLGDKYALVISFDVYEDGDSVSFSPIDRNNRPKTNYSLMLTTDQKLINSIANQLNTLRKVGDDDKLINRLIGILDESIVCSYCCEQKSVFSFSTEQICNYCFNSKYGHIILKAENGEYHGGHKLHLAGGKFGDHELGKMILTIDYFIFMKNDKDPNKTWEIVIPLRTIDMDYWHVSEESRRKNISVGGIDSDGLIAGVGKISESGKRHRIVIPYVDENGILNSPVFGVSSVSGQTIKEWAATLYGLIINLKKNNMTNGLSKERITNDSTDPITVLKLRFARGEISKQEFEEMKKMLE